MKKYLYVFILSVFTVLMAFSPSLFAAESMYSIEASPGSIDFGTQAVGSVSGAETVTISNTGSVSVSMLTLEIINDTAGYFSINSTTCGATLSEGTSCTANIVFAPNTEGSFTANLSIDTDETGYILIDLAGTGNTTSINSNNSDDDNSGCDAAASTGKAGKGGFGPAALGLAAMLGLVMATAAVRRRFRS